MIEFFIVIARVTAAFWRTLKNDTAAKALIFFVLIILASGTIFFIEIEHWDFVRAFYYCVLTLTTVGTGDLMPHTDIGRLFTVFYLFLGVGAMLGALQLIAKHAVAQSDGPEFMQHLGKRKTPPQE